MYKITQGDYIVRKLFISVNHRPTLIPACLNMDEKTVTFSYFVFNNNCTYRQIKKYLNDINMRKYNNNYIIGADSIFKIVDNEVVPLFVKVLTNLGQVLYLKSPLLTKDTIYSKLSRSCGTSFLKNVITTDKIKELCFSFVETPKFNSIYDSVKFYESNVYNTILSVFGPEVEETTVEGFVPEFSEIPIESHLEVFELPPTQIDELDLSNYEQVTEMIERPVSYIL